MKLLLVNTNASFTLNKVSEDEKKGIVKFTCTADPVQPLVSIGGRRASRHKRKVAAWKKYVKRCTRLKIEPDESRKPVEPTPEKLTAGHMKKVENTLSTYVRGKRFVQGVCQYFGLPVNGYKGTVTTEVVDGKPVHHITLTKIETIGFGKGKGSKSKADLRAEKKEYGDNMREYKKAKGAFKSAMTYEAKVDANQDMCIYYELLFGKPMTKTYTETKEKFLQRTNNQKILDDDKKKQAA